MSIEGQGHFFTIYFPGFVCFVLYLAKISGERLQDHWSSGFVFLRLMPVQYWSFIMFFRLGLNNIYSKKTFNFVFSTAARLSILKIKFIRTIFQLN